MLLRQIALVSESDAVGFRQLASVSAALQKQATRDFAPIWEIEATVDPFSSLEDVPLGYWPIIIMNDIKNPSAAGVHEDQMGQPFALVKADVGWSITASHECLEMLADPFGNRTVAGNAPPDALRPANTSKKSKAHKRSMMESAVCTRVEYLLEVCDPCERPDCGYSVNGIPVSDFYTPNYFDPVKSPGVRYDFTGHIQEPLQVLAGGYLSWKDPVSGKWWQKKWLNNEKLPVVVSVDAAIFSDEPSFNIRSAIDHATQSMLEGLTFDDNGNYFSLRTPADAAVHEALRTGKILKVEKIPDRFLKLFKGQNVGSDEALAKDAATLRQVIDQIKFGVKSSGHNRAPDNNTVNH